MTKYIMIFIVLTIISCSDRNSFENYNCSKETIKESYIRIGSLTNDDGDDLGEHRQVVENNLSLYPPCSVFKYSCDFISSGKRWKSQVWMKNSNNRFVNSDAQREIVILYSELDDVEKRELESHRKNSGLSNKWVDLVKTGTVVNNSRVWLHPFRSNHMDFTEISPFPEIRLPAEIGRQWSSSLDIGEGWGDWADLNVISYYEIVAKEAVEVPFGKIENCWKISASGTSDIGEQYLDAWFSLEHGFVKLNYINSFDQKLNIELERIEIL